MEIRKSRQEDLPEIMDIYARARKFMAESGNPDQWGDDWPPQDIIESDVAGDFGYVCEDDGKVAAVFFYEFADDPLYGWIDGAWLDDEPYGVVHRLASGGTRKGAARFCLRWAYGQCGNIRIDTHEKNVPMRSLLEKEGYTLCGNVHCHDGALRVAYQKHGGPSCEQVEKAGKSCKADVRS